MLAKYLIVDHCFGENLLSTCTILFYASFSKCELSQHLMRKTALVQYLVQSQRTADIGSCWNFNLNVLCGADIQPTLRYLFNLKEQHYLWVWVSTLFQVTEEWRQVLLMRECFHKNAIDGMDGMTKSICTSPFDIVAGSSLVHLLWLLYT